MAHQKTTTTAPWSTKTDTPNSNSGSRPTFSRKGFKITTQKLPILKAGPIEKMTNDLGITPPEMIFGDNFVQIEHEKTGWSIAFNAYDALDRVDKTGQKMLKVAYSKEWQRSREHTHAGIKEVVKPFDWSYSTDYQGTLNPSENPFEPCPSSIPLELLKRPDPILFFDDVILFEDELADNDNVLFRLRDTRVYVDFNTQEVIREYQARELEYEKVREILVNTREDAPAAMRDSNKMATALPVVEESKERVLLA